MSEAPVATYGVTIGPPYVDLSQAHVHLLQVKLQAISELNPCLRDKYHETRWTNGAYHETRCTKDEYHETRWTIPISTTKLDVPSLSTTKLDGPSRG